MDANKRDYYQVLGVDKNADDKTIKRAYRRLAKQYHPDVNKSSDAEPRFREINEAYQVLSDSSKRSAYDQFGHGAGADKANFKESGFGGGFGQGFGGFSQGQQGNFGNFRENFQQGFSFEDLFEDLLNPFGNKRGRGQKQQASFDLYESISVDFMVSVEGKTIPLSVNTELSCDQCNGKGAVNSSDIQTCKTCEGHGSVRQVIGGIFSTTTICPTCRGSKQQIINPCSKCSGKGVNVGKKEVKINVPSGIHSGQTIRVAGVGKFDRFSNSYGDLYVKVLVKEHAVFKRVENDIIITVPVFFTTSIMGGEISVPTLSKKYEKVKIPAGAADGKKYLIKTIKGMPILKVNSLSLRRYGNYYIETRLVFPKKAKLTREQLNILSKMNTAENNPEYENYLEQINSIYKNN